MTLPTLFVPHGAPTFALRPGAAGAALVTLAQQLERPKAIIVVSPHWETTEPTVGSATDLETLYDFGGFPDELYKLKYPTHSNPALAQQVADCLKTAGYAPRIDAHRGL
ncbi:MAG: DODA-type extradiol aromatic ring-opening family dioxygenase, partial [Fluviibacter sp.]